MGYYTDAVNNLTGAANNVSSAVISAAVAGEHFKNQEKSMEEGYLLKKIDTAEGLNNTNENLAKQDVDIKREELKKTGLEVLGKDYDEQIGQMEDTGMTDTALIRDWEENMQAINDVSKKIEAMQITRNQIENQKIRLELHNEVLDKFNPKLAKKYGGIK